MTGRRGHASTRRDADLATLITRRHEALREHVVPARSGDVEGVHQARVASRRLREIVPVFGAGLRGVRVRSLRRRLRQLTRALGPVRELDVASAMIDELDAPQDDQVQLRQVWRAAIELRRREPVRALRKALNGAARRALYKRLEQFAEARAVSDDPEWRRALASRLSSRARDLRSRVEQTGALFHPEALHEVRIAAKKLRYALEITSDTGLARVGRSLATLKKSQDTLGRLHDLDVLLGLLRAVPEASEGEPLREAATAVAAALDREARWLHARYLRTRPALARVAEHTLDHLITRVRPSARRSRADRTADAR